VTTQMSSGRCRRRCHCLAYAIAAAGVLVSGGVAHAQAESADAPAAAPVSEPFAFADFTWMNGNSLSFATTGSARKV
jgi:hypothetical protein